MCLECYRVWHIVVPPILPRKSTHTSHSLPLHTTRNPLIPFTLFNVDFVHALPYNTLYYERKNE